MDLDAPLPVSLDEVRACMSERGLLELELGIERATSQKLRQQIASLVNAGQTPPPADDVVEG